MKKNVLTHAVIAGIVGVAGVGSIADAVNLNPDGLGQVLIYPYYTTQGGNDTLFTVVNTADVGKAVKVRFLEGRNSREVLDFHLYLSPHDVWTGAIVASGAGAGVVTFDNSCTVPDIRRGGLGFEDYGRLAPFGGSYIANFVNWAYTGSLADDTPDAPPALNGLDRTREGYIEIIEMGNLTPGGNPAAWATHNSSGEPANCLALNQEWFLSGRNWNGGDTAWGLSAPDGTGQLFGNAMIVNPARGTVNGYAADAIEGFNHFVIHQDPGNVEPGLEAVNNPGNDLAATAYVFSSGTLVAATYDESVSRGKVDAITALYMSPRVINEFYVEESGPVNFASEWVINFPTKRYYVDVNPSLDFGVDFVSAVRAPFEEAFTSTGSCQEVSITLYDREEQTVTAAGGGFSPRPPGPDADSLCWEAQVITFNQGDRFSNDEPSDILGSTYYKNVTTNYEAGWAHVNFLGSPSLRASAEGVVFNGLPVTGFFATNADNGDMEDGVLANYSALFRHRTERSIDLLS